MTRDPEWAATYQRVLGGEIRHEREKRKWSRDDFRRHLQLDNSVQSIVTHELGTRGISHVLLVQYAMTLGANLNEMLDRVHMNVFSGNELLPGYTVDLTVLCELDDPHLAPLCRWARNRLLHRPNPDGPTKTVRLDLQTVEALSLLCGLDMIELVRRLPLPQATGKTGLVRLGTV